MQAAACGGALLLGLPPYVCLAAKPIRAHGFPPEAHCIGAPIALGCTMTMTMSVPCATGATVAAFLGNWLFMWVGNRQANRLRELYLASVLHQDIEYFDVHVTTGGLLQGLNQDAVDVQVSADDWLG